MKWACDSCGHSPELGSTLAFKQLLPRFTVDLLLSSGPVHKLLPSSTSVRRAREAWDGKSAHLHHADFQPNGRSCASQSSWHNNPAPLCQEMSSLPSASWTPNIFKHFFLLSTWEVLKVSDNSWFSTPRIQRKDNLHAMVYAKLIWMCKRTKQT